MDGGIQQYVQLSVSLDRRVTDAKPLSASGPLSHIWDLRRAPTISTIYCGTQA